MFFLLSKLLDVFASPVGMGLLWLVLAYWWRRRRPRWSRRLAGLGFFTLYFSSLPVVSNALWRALEASASPPPQSAPPYDAVIVLGGIVDDAVGAFHHLPEYNDHIDRLIYSEELLKKDVARVALLSGGADRRRGPTEAQLMAKQLIDWGVSADRLVTEDESRNTRENAVYTAAIVRQRGWQRLLLVTSAFHMKRALGCFAKVGLYPDAAPADFHGARIRLGADFFLPRGNAIGESSAAIREWVGRVVYRLVGYSTTW